MIIELIQVVGTSGFAAYAFYRSGSMHRLSAELRRGTSLTPPSPKAKPNLAAEIERLSLQADHEERQKLLSSPTGWLLDPFRYPTNPHEGRAVPAWEVAIDARMELKARMARLDMGLEPMYVGPAMINPQATYRMVMTPRCPNCGEHDHVEASSTHRGEASMWWCRVCEAEFTRDGETKKSIKRRKLLLAQKARDDAALAAKKEAERLARVLPCGCSGEVTTRSYPSGGWDMGRYAVCLTCNGCWDYAPRMDDTGNPRKMHPRSGPVEWPNGNKLEIDVPFDLPLPPANRD
jgi:ribosomal protein L37AE/L43A